MKKTTYVIIAILTLIVIVEAAFIYALSTTGVPYDEYLKEHYGYVPGQETETVEAEAPQIVHLPKLNMNMDETDIRVTLWLPDEAKDSMLSREGSITVDTLIIIAPHQIIDIP